MLPPLSTPVTMANNSSFKEIYAKRAGVEISHPPLLLRCILNGCAQELELDLKTIKIRYAQHISYPLPCVKSSDRPPQ